AFSAVAPRLWNALPKEIRQSPTLSNFRKELKTWWCRIYGELALCTGLLAEGMGCPISSPTLDAFFVKIHNEYFANCSLPTSTFVTQPSIGTVTILTFLTVCLVPISVVLLLRKI
uniref:Receptor activity modifying protein 1 n=1 Tax=Anolis carolinensis TaxID=28377 RepID=A0A803TXG6_ANOCA